MHVDLLELPYFEGISLDALVTLVDLMAPVQFAAGDVVVREGSEAPPPLYIATQGRLIISKRSPDGTCRDLAELDCPTLFGEIEMFCQIPAVCSAKALTAVAAFRLDRPTFDRLFAERDPAIIQFTFNVARVACHRLAIADDMLTQVLAEKDLCSLRRSVWARLGRDDDFQKITGAFRAPSRS